MCIGVYIDSVARFMNQKIQKISVGIINDLHTKYVDITQLHVLMFVTVRPSFVDTLFLVNRPHPGKPAAWNVIIVDYYYEYH